MRDARIEREPDRGRDEHGRKPRAPACGKRGADRSDRPQAANAADPCGQDRPVQDRRIPDRQRGERAGRQQVRLDGGLCRAEQHVAARPRSRSAGQGAGATAAAGLSVPGGRTGSGQSDAGREALASGLSYFVVLAGAGRAGDAQAR
ncbi:MAG: hypothetical protein B7X90_15135 [Novosphingobium sp. 17-62-19]|nr:MAG: hypothetical protein B7X90_15135 [Novosphingobium sp. 17-62-19]